MQQAWSKYAVAGLSKLRTWNQLFASWFHLLLLILKNPIYQLNTSSSPSQIFLYDRSHFVWKLPSPVSRGRHGGWGGKKNIATKKDCATAGIVRKKNKEGARERVEWRHPCEYVHCDRCKFQSKGLRNRIKGRGERPANTSEVETKWKCLVAR